MAGLRMSVVVCATAFLIGLLFTHWTADSLTLWKSPETQTDDRLWTAATYYSVLTRMPAGLAYVYAAVALAGGATILWSLRDGRAGNLMFDGGSIFLYGSAIYLYIHNVLPNILTNFTSLPPGFHSQPAPAASSPPPPLLPFPPSLRAPTLDLASSHLVCSVMLTGVLALQAGRWWAEQADVDDDDETLVAEDADEDRTKTREVTPVSETRKTK